MVSGNAAMTPEMLEELAHVFYLEATEWEMRTCERDATYLVRVSVELIRRAAALRFEAVRRDARARRMRMMRRP